MRFCSVCNAKATYRCGKCKNANYCGTACYKVHQGSCSSTTTAAAPPASANPIPTAPTNINDIVSAPGQSATIAEDITPVTAPSAAPTADAGSVLAAPKMPASAPTAKQTSSAPTTRTAPGPSRGGPQSRVPPTNNRRRGADYDDDGIVSFGPAIVPANDPTDVVTGEGELGRAFARHSEAQRRPGSPNFHQPTMNEPASSPAVVAASSSHAHAQHGHAHHAHDHHSSSAENATPNVSGGEGLGKSFAMWENADGERWTNRGRRVEHPPTSKQPKGEKPTAENDAGANGADAATAEEETAAPTTGDAQPSEHKGGFGRGKRALVEEDEDAFAEDPDNIEILRPHHLRSIRDTRGIMSALRAKELQKLIRSIDASPARLEALSAAMFNIPEFSDFCGEVLQAIKRADRRVA